MGGEFRAEVGLGHLIQAFVTAEGKLRPEA